MRRKEYICRIAAALLAVCFMILCMSGCTEKNEDDLKTFSFEEQEDLNIEENKEETEENASVAADEVIYVYVCGAVECPGVYELKTGARVYEAILCAGGLTKEAAQNSVNQAKLLEDGEQIYIPAQEEVDQLGKETDSSDGITSDGKVNINTATKEELMTLNGIGESRAESILAYREEHGGFSCVEDLMNVEGIKEGIFQKIKDSITVNSGS